MILELAVVLRCSPRDVLELDDFDLATLVDVLGNGARRR
jgi:hypothetical protein